MIERGDVEVERQYGPVGAGIGFIAGAYFGGAGYLTAHGLTDYQGASFTGFMAASLGGGFLGAISGGSETYTVFFGSNFLNFAVNFGVTWIDNYVVPNEVGGQ